MSRYIDVDKLGIGRANPDVFESEDYADGWNSAIRILEKADVEDVTKVVRCKDCKYWDNVNLYAVKKRNHKGVGLCIRRGATNGEDFCSYGERKDKE